MKAFLELERTLTFVGRIALGALIGGAASFAFGWWQIQGFPTPITSLRAVAVPGVDPTKP